MAETTIARTIYNEARSDGVAGMTAVAEAIYNRIGHPGYGNKQSAYEVVSAPNQFLGYGTTAPTQFGPGEEALWNSAKELATKLNNKQSPGSTTEGAHAFHQSSSSSGLVGTAFTATYVTKIGAHYFFRVTKK